MVQCRLAVVVLVVILEGVVHAPAGVLETRLGTALGTWFSRNEADVAELQLRRGALDGARLFIAPMATFFHHGRSPGSGRR